MQGAGYRNREVRATSWLTNYHNLTVNSRSIQKALFFKFLQRKGKEVLVGLPEKIIPASLNWGHQYTNGRGNLYYYLSGAVCLSVCKLFLLYGFGEQTSRILEFKPKGLDF